MAALTIEQIAATYFDGQLKEPLRQQLIGRQLFAKQQVLGPEQYRVNFNKIKELGAASSGRSIPSVGTGKDNVKVDASEIDLIFFFKEYEIPRQDWNLYKTKGQDLSAINVISAAQRVGEAEDAYLINGWIPSGSATNYVENGLYKVAGNTESSSLDFATFGNPTKKISAAWDLLDADNIVGVNMNMLLNPTQFNQAWSNRSTNGVREWPDLIDMLNPYPNAPKGNIYKVYGGNITAATGLMVPVDPVGKYMDLVIGANYINEVFQTGPSATFSPMGGITVSSLIARFTYPDAICALTGI